jgi:hypothetical protein
VRPPTGGGEVVRCDSGDAVSAAGGGRGRTGWSEGRRGRKHMPEEESSDEDDGAEADA